ncbi:hypothetical protein BVRB_9g221320 [Beta vulgaris subsp. vulgaris]|nr:hypothetical protein BVRB_9g221320 [Beta vulgaris subsp. vulgaris]
MGQELPLGGTSRPDVLPISQKRFRKWRWAGGGGNQGSGGRRW